jgi:hypothetical protein
MDPASIAVQVLETVDAAVRVAIRSGVFQLLVALDVPLVPIIAGDFGDQLEFRLAHRAPDEHGLPLPQVLGARGGVDLGLALANRDLGCPVRHDGNAIAAHVERAHRNVGRTQVDVGRGIAQHAEGNGAARDLHLIPVLLELGEPNFRVGSEPDHVGPVQLHFRPRAGAGEQTVRDDQRRVDGGGNPVSRVATLDGNVAVNHADARDSATELFILILRDRRERGQQCDG